MVQETDPMKGLFQGVFHDENGRPTHYRFQTAASGLINTADFAAYDLEGRPQVMHIFDPMDSEDVRGISKLASGFRKHIQAEMLDDATLQMAILQTVFAITLTSDAPSQDDRWQASIETGYENDDFTKNMVTILAAERLAMAIYRPEAFIYGDLGYAA